MSLDKKLQVVPLGGVGEFGMNMMAIRYGDDIIVIDAGMMFPGDDLLGVDIVTPDMTFLKENREQVRALLLTHGHEDHIGAVAFFLEEFDVPVYATPFTLSLVERRLDEYDFTGANLKPVKPKDT
ncbi:MAG TPA: ribonuclease J, partial [Bryobacteraceae bacterium]|nr:ribonuclease J [Bryobacteraceae bacterium]